MAGFGGGTQRPPTHALLPSVIALMWDRTQEGYALPKVVVVARGAPEGPQQPDFYR